MKKNIFLLAALLQVIVFNTGYAQTADIVASSMSICTGASIQFTDNSTGPNPITQWNWDFDGVAPSSITQGPHVIPFPNPGNYTITLDIVDNAGGTDNAQIQVEVLDCNLAAGFAFDDNICVGDCIRFTDTSSGNPITWMWSFDGGGVPNTSNLQDPGLVCFPTAGTYNIQLTVTDLQGSNSSVSNTLTVFANPTVDIPFMDTIIDLAGSADLVATTVGGTNFLWEPEEFVADPTELITFAKPQETTNYTVTATDPNGCFAIDSVDVYVNFQPGIGVPGAFSPNGDGLNDLLVVEGPGLELMTFKVYNRYGQLVFETSRQKNGWDGNFRGKPQKPGVFLWTLDYQFNTGKAGKLTGNTTLVR